MNTLIRATGCISLLAVSVVSFAAGFEIEQHLLSRYGEIRLLRPIDDDGYRFPPSVITLDGRRIFDASETTEPYVTLHGLYRTQHGQALLISQNCGGSGCRIAPLSFIVLNGKSKVEVVTSKDFNSETAAIRAAERSGKVTVDLGYYRQKRKFAVLDSDTLRVMLIADNQRALLKEECHLLHSAAEACKREHGSPSGCTDYSAADFSAGGFSGSNADVWAVRHVSHYPGFNRHGFIEECNSACTSGTLSSYEAFQNHACQAPAP